jgi:hypothetical protein
LFYRKILFVMNVAASLAYSILDHWKWCERWCLDYFLILACKTVDWTLA